MSTTWLSRLTSSHGHRPRLYFTIQGIPHVFQEDSVDVPTALESSLRPRTKLVTSIKQSPRKLPMATRLVEGGTLMLELMDDDEGTLKALFTPRRYRSTYVETTCNIGDTSVDVKATTQFAVGSYAYIGVETMRIDGVTASAFSSVARAQFNSREQKHLGALENGADVFTSPPSWKGRRVYLTSYFKNDDGSTTSDLSRSEGVFVIEKAPKHVGDGKWVIQCSDLSDEFYRRPIGAGLREMQLDMPRVLAFDGANHTLDVGDAAVDQFVVGVQRTQVLMRDEIDQSMCFDLLDVDGSVLEMSVAQHVSVESLNGPHPIKSVRHIAILKDMPAQIALQVLISKLGNQAVDSFDQLPGGARTIEYGPSWRMGAGISQDEVDTAAFLRVGSQSGAFSFVVDGETTVADFLFDFCLHCNCVAYVTREGQLSVRAIASEANDATVDVDHDMLLPRAKLSTEYDEDVIKTRVSFECNYDPITTEFAGVVNFIDGKLMDRYPGEGETLRLSSKTIVVAGYPTGKRSTAYGLQSLSRPTMTLEALEGIMRPIMVSQGRGRAFVSSEWHLDVMQLELGDLANLTVAAPDLEGADVGEGVGGHLARLVEIGPEWDGPFAVATFELLDKPYVIAPACPIESAAGEVLTLSTGSLEAYEPATPGQMFADGSAVQVYDASTGTIDDRTVVSHTDTTVTLNAAPSFVIATPTQTTADMLRAAPQDDADAELTNDDGFDGLDFLYQMPDDENASTVVEVTRWR